MEICGRVERVMTFVSFYCTENKTENKKRKLADSCAEDINVIKSDSQAEEAIDIMN